MDIAEEKLEGAPQKRWVEKIREGDQQAFEELFFEYFSDLCSYAFQMTNSSERAKDIVQEVFCKLWKRRQNWTIHTSLKAYLFRAVRNETLNQLDRKEHRKEVREQFSTHEQPHQPKQGSKTEEVDQQLLDEIWKVVGDMPQRRRSVFMLHRKHGLSYKEIAKVLDITRKTVENHMGLALDDIRQNIDTESI